MKKELLNTLIIGSGAAGLACAYHLMKKAKVAERIALYSEGLKMGTSINTGSDKQTYYKLGLYGDSGDAPMLMATDLMRGGSMHGDIALVEAALSSVGFANLVNIGVPFPHDEFGQYIGYKTDHDPKCRATSTGPYTSRDMCLALIKELQQTKCEINEKRICVKLIVENDAEGEKVVKGGVFINLNAENLSDMWEVVYAKHVVFATGGPGGLYEKSVYPSVHTGGIGLALQESCKACNLPESQFGMASTKFRWNVSGSYMQVLPRIISVDESGVEREFLREYFGSVSEMYDMIFLKGYQWPFAAGHVKGSSLIDIFVYIETMVKGRKVYLDYRTDPADLDFSKLNAETYTYLDKSKCLVAKPIERLKIMNKVAIELYQAYSIDIEKEPLEIAICAQHNNGGLAGDKYYESLNIKNLFVIGEVNGSHGVTRPGGSALNAGQVGAFRAAESISARNRHNTSELNFTEFKLDQLTDRLNSKSTLDWKKERKIFQHRMSEAGGFIRDNEQIKQALVESVEQYNMLTKSSLGELSIRDISENLRNEQLLFAQIVYLQAMIFQTENQVGSRGGAITLSPNGEKIHEKLSFKIASESVAYRGKILETVANSVEDIVSEFVECRKLPNGTTGWFENVWRDYREDKIFGELN